jgi:hypothetical protein
MQRVAACVHEIVHRALAWTRSDNCDRRGGGVDAFALAACQLAVHVRRDERIERSTVQRLRIRH